jgi:hypothetical protein
VAVDNPVALAMSRIVIKQSASKVEKLYVVGIQAIVILVSDFWPHSDLAGIASQVGSSIMFQSPRNYTLSSSEVFAVLNSKSVSLLGAA